MIQTGLMLLTRRQAMTKAWYGVLSQVMPMDASRNLVPTLQRVRLPVVGLDRRFDGLRIGQVSDTHIGAVLGLDHLQRAVSVFGKRPPDIMVATGDLVDDASLTGACLDLVASVRAPLGHFYILGNHETYAGKDTVLSYARPHPKVRLLQDQDVTLNVGGARFNVSGMDYDVEKESVKVSVSKRGFIPRLALQRTFPDMVDRVKAVTDHVGSADFRLNLTHHPDLFDATSEAGVELTLSGHTHGGQVAPLFTTMAGDAFPYVLGHYERAGRHLYVNGGTGHWMPLRVGVPAEVTEITLVRV
jgi:predicted MPP superfamily phosphohydrolase